MEPIMLCGRQIPDLRDLCARQGLTGVHPAAEMFPLMTDEEMRGLVDDVGANGFVTPLAVYQGLLLDGRNRLIASWITGVAVEARDVETESPTQYAISENLHRRHLTTGQRAFIAVEVLPMLEEEAAQRMVAGVADPEADLPQGHRAPQSRDKAAEITGTSGRAVAQAKRVKDKAPDLQRQVESGEISLNAAEQEVRRRERAEANPDAYKPRPASEEAGNNWDVMEAVMAAAEKTEAAARVAGKTNQAINEDGRTIIHAKIHKIRNACDFLESWLAGGGIDKALTDLLGGENNG